ncbi:hypothetical protein BGW80DRAFT_1559977 [Lactifluus volemus]|nr:hypothetical protein BGW80DRAFT_1559977 [Lactifluus volemus]
MSPSNTQDIDTGQPLNKGKARAVNGCNQEPTETTPLLPHQSYVIHTDDDNLDTTGQSNRSSLLSTLTTVFLTTLFVSILLILLLISLAYSYAAKASQLSDRDILDTGLLFRGPDALDVLNISEHGEVWLRIDGSVGFDAGAIVGVKPDDRDNFLLDAWKAIGRWGIRNLDVVSITLSSINITSHDDPPTHLASIRTFPFQIPLTADPPDDSSWLTPISLPVHVQPSQNLSTWLNFARESWRHGYVVAQASISRAKLQGGPLRGATWRSSLSTDRSNLTVGLRMKIPVLPSLPAPGDSPPLPSISDLVHLTQISVSSGAENLTLDAKATIFNPIPSTITLTAPPLPFIVWVPPPPDANDDSLIPVVSVTSAPFTLTHPNITFSLHGNVIPIHRSAIPALSFLLSDYLSGVDHPISITSLFKLFSNYTAHTIFPAPHPRPEVLRNVTIESMKIHASGTTILANGIVHARLAFPKGMEVMVHVNRVLPDVLVFDGPLPTVSTAEPTVTTSSMTEHDSFEMSSKGDDDDDDDDDDVPPARPLPSPLPPHAFARIRPHTWATAMSSPTEPRRDWNEHGHTTLHISAWFSDVPLEVLPGRDREFRSFVGKVIFGRGDGAVAGVQGVAAVGVRVEGLSIGDDEAQIIGGDGAAKRNVGGGLVLTDLPFQGSVRVGRKGLG